MESIVEVKNLKKHFKVAKGLLHAIDGISLSINERETMGIVGESGCGKSTLGKTMLRLIEPTSGEIYFEGEEISVLTRKQFKALRTKMQMIFQDPYSSLDPRMSVRQLISEPLHIFNQHDSKESLKKHVAKLMETVGIANRFANSFPHELDGGRRQRVGIARALSLNPRFIVCDEPVSALDVSIQAQVLNLLMDIQEEFNLTYMFITHDLSVVRHISTDICVMYLGRIVEKCDAKELFSNTMHPYSQALLSAIPLPCIHNRPERIILQGELTSPINPNIQCRFAPRCPISVERCFEEEPNLKLISPNHWVACHLID